MEQERDFKGVWIPKEIWCNEELSIYDKVIFTEIDSLDNDNHCTAGNDYFSKFCGISTSTVSKSIKHLEELGMIEILEFNGRVRKISVVKKRKLPSKKTKAAFGNLRPNNIYNNPNNKKEISIKNNTNYTKSLVKKKSLYQKMEDEIHLFTDDTNIQGALYQFLNLQLEIYREQGKTYYSNIFKNRLNKLKKDFDEKDWLEVINTATEKGWQNFYPVKDYNPQKKKKCNADVIQEKATDEEMKEIERWQKEQRSKGKKMVF